MPEGKKEPEIKNNVRHEFLTQIEIATARLKNARAETRKDQVDPEYGYYLLDEAQASVSRARHFWQKYEETLSEEDLS